MEWIILGLFCAGLVLCIAGNFSVLLALAFGLVLFLLYGRSRGFSWGALLGMTLDGVKTVRNILVTFVLIGVLTAVWRAAGTIPVIVCYASTLIRPAVFLVMTFLLNCGVSVLMGTSFGTVATMGVICATMGAAIGADPRLTGGAILSGIYFGDRCSPVSTSALLVAELTGTDIFDNIRRMLLGTLVPFLLTCAVYGAAGLVPGSGHAGVLPDLRGVFGREFSLHWLALAPAVVILLLSALRINVKLAMTASILTAVLLCVTLQGVGPSALVRMALLGFRAADREAGAMLDGGGIQSMLRVGGIVCLSSSYSGIFRETGLLDGAKDRIDGLAGRTNNFFAILMTAALTALLGCSQTLSIMLTHQLCGDLGRSDSDFALDLEDTSVVIAPLVPWSIAGTVPLSVVGAPMSALLFACYLYLLPLWRLAGSLGRWRTGHRTAEKGG